MGIGLYDRMVEVPGKPGLLPRPRVDAALAAAMEEHVVLVTAGAGYGKTQAVSLFLGGGDYNVAWLQLSGLDNYRARFWEAFLYALSFRDSEAAARLGQRGFPDSLAGFDRFLRQLADEMQADQRYALVFDDVHLLQDDAIRDFIGNLIAARLDNLYILLLSRTELPYGRAAGASNRLSTDTLRFTADEIAGYLRMRGVPVTEEECGRIERHTEGWPLAVYLVGLILKNGEKQLDDSFDSAMPLIFQTIEEEIFAGCTPPIQEVLIKLSLLDEFQTKLLKDVAGEDIESTLEVIRDSMFIHYKPYTKSYQFHHLFLEFLKTKQILLKENQIAEVYQKAAGWYRQNGFLSIAALYYGRCGCHEAVWDIIAHYDIDMPQNEAGLFLRLIEAFPAELTARYPLIGVVHGRLLLNNGRLEESRQELSAIKRRYESLPPTPENRAVVGEASIFLALLSLALRDGAFAGLFRTAADCLPGGSVLVDSRLYVNNGNYAIPIEKPEAGALKAFEQAMCDAMPYAAKAMNGCCYGQEYLTMAEAGYYTGGWEKAERNAYQAMYMAGQKGQNDIVCGAYFMLIRKNIAEGRYAKSARLLDELCEKLERPDSNDCLVITDVIKGWYYARLGDMERVPQWIMHEEQSIKVLSPNSTCKDRLIRAYCLLKTEQYPEMLALIGYLEELYDAKGFLIPRIKVQILKAIVLHRVRDTGQAARALAAAYELAHANELVTPFVEYGSYLRALIDAVRREPVCPVPAPWLDMVYRKACTYAKRLEHVGAQYRQAAGKAAERAALTRREREILRGLCQGLTRNEIAESLHISSNTAKSALQTIYNKLGAVNSADAVRIAMQTGLVD